MTDNESLRWEKVRAVWEIIDRLRGEPGCPWDRKQTPESVQTYLVEEAHEAASAVRSGHVREIADELGDLLFMVLFLVHLYEEDRKFTLEKVCDLVSEKMIRRHPHVFGDVTVHSTREVRDNWEKIKAGEKAAAGTSESVVPESLPALMRAYRIISRLSQQENTQWNDVDARSGEFVSKSRRLAELMEESAFVSQDLFGELLIEIVNLARIKGYRAEDCLHASLKQLPGSAS
jgi:MazG family protein